jgi:hypothetical protein
MCASHAGLNNQNIKLNIYIDRYSTYVVKKDIVYTAYVLVHVFLTCIAGKNKIRYVILHILITEYARIKDKV